MHTAVQGMSNAPARQVMVASPLLRACSRYTFPLVVTIAACGASRPQTTTTTAGEAPSGETMPVDEFVRAQHECEQVKERTIDEQGQIDRLTSEVQMAKERDDVASRAWSEIDNADVALKSLQADVEHAASYKERQQIENAIADTKDKRAVVERDARTIPTRRGAAWLRYKESIERSIDDLHKTLQSREK
jgi:hypothetical protein